MPMRVVFPFSGGSSCHPHGRPHWSRWGHQRAHTEGRERRRRHPGTFISRGIQGLVDPSEMYEYLLTRGICVSLLCVMSTESKFYLAESQAVTKYKRYDQCPNRPGSWVSVV